MRRLKPEYLALIFQRLFEYEPVPRYALLKEIELYDEPLFCPLWMATMLWILQFDEECSKVAKRIWNKYGMAIRTGVIDLSQEEKSKNIYFYLRSKNTNIFDSSLKAAVSAIEIFQNRFDLIIDDLIEFYNSEMQIIDNEVLSNQLQTSDKQDDNFSSNKVLADDRLNRIAVPEILKRTAHLVQANSFKKVFEFFVTKGCLDQNEQV